MFRVPFQVLRKDKQNHSQHPTAYGSSSSEIVIPPTHTHHLPHTPPTPPSCQTPTHLWQHRGSGFAITPPSAPPPPPPTCGSSSASAPACRLRDPRPNLSGFSTASCKPWWVVVVVCVWGGRGAQTSQGSARTPANPGVERGHFSH